jgi:hypothetical protein
MQKSFQAIFLSAIKNILFRSEVRSRCLYVVKMVYTFPVGFQGILPLLEPHRLYVAQDIQILGLPWHLCPTQKVNLRRKAPSVQEKMRHAVQRITAGRKVMETEFIRIVS